MSNEKQSEEQKPQQKKPKMRQVIIETDGNNISIAKAETAGNLELIAILSTILNKLQTTSSTR